MKTDQNEIAVRFLLGKVTEAEQSDIEKEFFRNTDSFENILIAENSLTDAYVSKRLSPEDRRLFEKRLLVNPRQRQRAAFAGTLVKYVSRLPVEVEGLSPSRLTFFTRLFSGQPLFSYSLAAAVFLLLVGAVFWWTSVSSRRLAGDDLARSDSPAEIDSQKPVLNGQVQEQGPAAETNTSLSSNNTASNAGQPRKRNLVLRDKPLPIISTVILQLGSTRDAQSAKAFVIPKKTTLLDFQLKFEEGDFSSYFAVLETADGQQVWRGKVPGSRKNSDGNTVILSIPADRIRRGDYVMSLKGHSKMGTYEPVAEYSFTVDR